MLRLALIVALGSLSVSALAGSAAGADAPEPEHCPPQFSRCNTDRFGYWIPMQISGVETVAPIRRTGAARKLYRHLLGDHLEMPADPKVRIIFNDLRLGTYAPGVQDVGPTKYSSRYLEFGIEVLAKYGPHLGWHDLRLILNNRAGFELGRGDLEMFNYYGATPKFLADNTYDADPATSAGFARSTVGGRFVMRADWEPAPELAGVYHDPSPLTRMGDGTEDGDPWQCRVSQGDLYGLPGAPAEWLTGRSLPAANPTAMPEPLPARVRVRLTDDLDQFNVPSAADASLLDAKPLPRLFPAGTSLATLLALDQENPGHVYGPQQQLLIAEGHDVTADGPAAAAAAKCRAPSGASGRNRRAAALNALLLPSAVGR